VGAVFIEGLLGLLVLIPGGALLGASFAAGHDALCRDFNDEVRTCRRPAGGLLALAILLFVVAFIAWYVFLVVRLGRTGQTPGRKVCGIKVVSRDTGQPIGAGRALGRYLFAGFISGQICYLGYLWMLWDSQKRTWHDMVVGSVVVRA
jgi:uncharacterized RDD family membrane protein YckC